MSSEKTKEQIYDEEIYPLMAKILDICKEHRIAMLADFHMDNGLKCTSARLAPEYNPHINQLKAIRLLAPQPDERGRERGATAETVSTDAAGQPAIRIQLGQ